MGEAERDEDAGAHWDQGLEAAVGADGPILAPFWVTGACCGARCVGEHPWGFSDAEAPGWLGPSGDIWDLHCPTWCPFPSCSGVSMLFPGGPSPGRGLRVGPYRDLLTLGKGCGSRNLGKKMGFGVIFLLVSQSCSPASLPTALMTLHMARVPHCPSSGRGTQG